MGGDAAARAALSASPITVDRRAAREAARRRRARRDTAIATVSTVVVLGALVTAIAHQQGLAERPGDVLLVELAEGLVPGRPAGLLARREALLLVEVVVLVARPGHRAGAHARARRRSRPLRLLGDALRRRPARRADDPRRLPRSASACPALELVGRAVRPGRARRRRARAVLLAPTWPRSTARGSSRCTRASARRRSRSG